MIPEFVDIGSPWEVLPPGVHGASVSEVEQRFAYTRQRKMLLDGFKSGLESLRRAGCKTVFLDGSFVTAKPVPGDFDACWDPCGVDDTKLDPILLDTAPPRRMQKQIFGGEFLIISPECAFDKFFQKDKYTGRKKGIILITS